MPVSLTHQSLAGVFTQHFAAARTRIHLDAGGQLPFETPEPVICPCSVIGKAQVVEAHFHERGYLRMVGSCGHELHLDLNCDAGIRTACFEDTSTDDGRMRHHITHFTYSLVQPLLRLGFTGVPSGYMKPEHMIHEGLYAILADRKGFTALTTRLSYLFECMAREDPICIWVDPHVAEAARHSIAPSSRLSDMKWYQHRCVFFLPQGCLSGPSDEECRILAYALIGPGIYDLLDGKNLFVVHTQRLFVWINAPDHHRSYMLDLRAQAYDAHPEFPGSPREQVFFKRCLELLLILNTLGLSPQASIDQLQLTRKSATKKERRKGKLLPRRCVNCRFLRFRGKIGHGTRAHSTGRKLRPHNKPGWFQRYHTKTGMVWHYRPPHRANAHLESRSHEWRS